MNITIDESKGKLIREGWEPRELDLYTTEAFEIISKYWIKVGWGLRYSYGFSWMGRPVIQLPEDMIRIQEVLYEVRPDVIVETGIAHGGSLIFYASLCKVLGKGRVIGVDVEIRPHNRRAIENHELFPYITLIEGDSVGEATIARVRSLVKPGESCLVMLDSNHTKDHVLAELRAYGSLVSLGSFIVVADGVMADVIGAPRAKSDWGWNNPRTAAEEFLRENREFVLEQPRIPFNEGSAGAPITYWPGGYLKRVARSGKPGERAPRRPKPGSTGRTT